MAKSMIESLKKRRIHRALENIGYNILRIKNEQIQNMPDVIAERIIQRYLEIVDTENKSTKITRELANNLKLWAVSFSRKLNDERWSVDYFKESLARFHSKL